MVNIILFCGAGISSNLLTNKMKEVSKRMELNLFITSYPEIWFEKYIDKADVVLVGPQIRYMFSKFKKSCDEKGIPIDVINNADYSTTNAENIINLALRLIDNYKRDK